jgi:hypothetical protein
MMFGSVLVCLWFLVVGSATAVRVGKDDITGSNILSVRKCVACLARPFLGRGFPLNHKDESGVVNGWGRKIPIKNAPDQNRSDDSVALPHLLLSRRIESQPGAIYPVVTGVHSCEVPVDATLLGFAFAKLFLPFCDISQKIISWNLFGKKQALGYTNVIGREVPDVSVCNLGLDVKRQRTHVGLPLEEHRGNGFYDYPRSLGTLKLKFRELAFLLHFSKLPTHYIQLLPGVMGIDGSRNGNSDGGNCNPEVRTEHRTLPPLREPVPECNRTFMGYVYIVSSPLCIFTGIVFLGAGFMGFREKWDFGIIALISGTLLMVAGFTLIQHGMNIVTQKCSTPQHSCNTVTGMANVLPKDKQIAVIEALAEGSSIRSIERLTGIHRDTIMRLGVRVGKAAKYCWGILSVNYIHRFATSISLQSAQDAVRAALMQEFRNLGAAEKE